MPRMATCGTTLEVLERGGQGQLGWVERVVRVLSGALVDPRSGRRATLST